MVASSSGPKSLSLVTSVLDADRTETVFVDSTSTYSTVQAQTEAERCLFCVDAPCIAACPTEIDIPQFIRKIATGNPEGAARTIFESNILGMSCARVCPVETLCVGACVYKKLDMPPVEIGRLQGFATEAAVEAGTQFFEPGAPSGKTVGLIGAGPASLSAAHQLRRLGHACIVYEGRRLSGGLNTTGVAPYKMKADQALAEVAWILDIGGIEVKTGVFVGEDVSWVEVRARHDAVFFGVGLGHSRALGIPGEDLPGVVGAVPFIERIKTGKQSIAGVNAAVVIGGGNTAVDAVRELLGLGVPRVTLVYRGDALSMKGYAHEWRAAQAQGASACFRARPLAFVGERRVAALKCRDIGSAVEFELRADLVLVAIGQDEAPCDLPLQRAHGHVVVDAQGSTSVPGVFAGGDCVNGGQEVVHAVAAGRRAAAAIDTYVRGGTQKDDRVEG